MRNLVILSIGVGLLLLLLILVLLVLVLVLREIGSMLLLVACGCRSRLLLLQGLLLLGEQVILNELKEESQVGLRQLLLHLRVLRVLLLIKHQLLVLLLKKAAYLALIVVQARRDFVKLLLSEVWEHG